MDGKRAFLEADGGHDIHKQLDLSGEPLIPDLRKRFKLRDAIPLLEYQDLAIQGRDYAASYLDYWNSTADEDGETPLHVPVPSLYLTRNSRATRRRCHYARGSPRGGDTRKILPHRYPPTSGVRVVAIIYL